MPFIEKKDENLFEEYQFFYQSVKKNKLLIVVVGIILFLIGAIFPVVDIFGLHDVMEMPQNRYAWEFAIFFWFFCILLLFAWKKQNRILANGLWDESKMIQEMIRLTELKIATSGQLKFHITPMKTVFSLSTFILIIIYLSVSMQILGGNDDSLIDKAKWLENIFSTSG